MLHCTIVNAALQNCLHLDLTNTEVLLAAICSSCPGGKRPGFQRSGYAVSPGKDGVWNQVRLSMGTSPTHSRSNNRVYAAFFLGNAALGLARRASKPSASQDHAFARSE